MSEREIIRVEADEQINGLVRRLRESGARQVTFVAPDETPALRNSVNLRLLKFYAEQEQKRLRLETGDAVVQRLADEAGIEWAYPQEAKACPSPPTKPAQASLPWATWASLGAGSRVAAGAQEGEGSQAVSGVPVPKAVRRPRALHLLAIPLLILLIGLWQLAAGPTVTVTVQPVVREHSTEVTLYGRVSPRTASAEVPLTLLEQPVSASATVPTTGRRRYGIARARGSVTFLNQETQAIKVPDGTIVTTAAGTAFRVVQGVLVPGVKTEYFMKIAVGLRAGQAEARIEAVEPGSEGNVSAGRITKVKSTAAGRLQVTNPEPLRGGEDRVVAVATAADVGRAEREAVATLARQARPALEGQLAKGLRLIPESVRLSPPTATAKVRSGDDAAQVEAAATATAFGLAYRPEVVRRAAVEAYLRSLPAGFAALEETISPGAPRFGRVEPQLADFLIHVTGQVVSRVDPAAVRQAVRGKTQAVAEAAVRALPGVESVAIEGARRRLPSWSGRLRIVIAQPADGTR
ncbi:MAG: baseplate J/gp47 family protein [Betaproteobacteria bacterium]